MLADMTKCGLFIWFNPLFKSTSYLQVTQDAAETEAMRRRLEVAESELKLALEGSRGQKEVDDLMEGSSSRLKADKKIPATGVEEETVRKQRSARKRHRGEEFIL